MYECPTCHATFWNETEVVVHTEKHRRSLAEREEGSPDPYRGEGLNQADVPDWER